MRASMVTCVMKPMPSGAACLRSSQALHVCVTASAPPVRSEVIDCVCMRRAQPIRTLDGESLPVGATVTATLPLALTASRNYLRVIMDCECVCEGQRVCV